MELLELCGDLFGVFAGVLEGLASVFKSSKLLMAFAGLAAVGLAILILR